MFWRTKRSHLLDLVESEKAALLGEDDLGVKLDVSESSGLVVKEEGNRDDGDGIESGLDDVEIGGNANVIDETSKGLDEKGRWTRMRVAKVSLMMCPFWFLAQLTFNISLKYTTVTSNTILSSTSSLFHVFGFTDILGREVHVVESLQCSSLYVWDYNCLLDNVLSDYVWARAVLLTTTTVATAGLTIQVPLAAIVDSFSGNKPRFTDYIGAAAVMVGFAGINIPQRFSANPKRRLLS